ncbi:GerMN domain-containing protein [Clostridium niameyense]|uniref:GerMN domain-containing protein n=1 Tax=Clostridium niameyense TaxID=1622073 RepID=A0A6M0RBG5_9CLOT|nr:GerMN domain-containing protein [Clostridium niameyense]NEZ47651.1 GerMN domain-containing protein [Clostridium niameyense]
MKKYIKLITFSLLVLCFLLFIGCEKKDNLTVNNKDKIKKIVFDNEKNNNIELELYFDSSNDENNSKMVKEERILKKDEVIAEMIIQELIKGPSVNSSLKPIFPKKTRLLSFSIKDNIAYVNLSKEAYYNMTEAREEAYLKSIIWSLTEISSIQKVQILIDNKSMSNISKNFDLSKPLGRDDITNAKRKDKRN